MLDLVVVGGGIVGLATARALLEAKPSLKITLIEAESKLAAHQTGNNSGVIHSGLYYKPGSLKARLCVSGRAELEAYCTKKGVPFSRCGKVVVATCKEQALALDELERRGRANGLDGIRRLTAADVKELEPAVSCVEGLHVPETGIVDYSQVCESFAQDLKAAGAEISLSTRLKGATRKDELNITTTQGSLKARSLINCAGLQSDRVARLCGDEPGLRIVPFRGEYYELKESKHGLVRSLIYPVPDPRFPFLGVHFTTMVGGGVEAGPNAVLSFKREGYHQTSFSVRDTLSFALYPGFWKMALRHWSMGMGEFYRSFSKRAFVAALQELIPEIRAEDLVRGGAGVRAQAMEKDGSLADDFRIVEAPQMIHVLNAPSPAATASISIGREIAKRSLRALSL